MILRSASMNDASAIASIFNDAIRTTMAVWKETPVSIEDRVNWIRTRQDNGHPVLVAEMDGKIHGYAGYAQLSANEGYRYCVENSIYVHPESKGQGIGRLLLSALIEHARAQGMHSMVSDMDAGNDGSRILHEKFGFQKVGLIRQAGYKNGEWRDLLILQLLLDADT